jgi:Tat protein secretion system quality control protein TatD with DNase activity
LRIEPAWVARTVERLATARGTDAAALGKQTVANARRFFKLA